MVDHPPEVMLCCPQCGNQVRVAPDQLNAAPAVAKCRACGNEAEVTVSTDAIKEQAAEEAKSHLREEP